jgi:site-specific recombinase XerD
MRSSALGSRTAKASIRSAIVSRLTCSKPGPTVRTIQMLLGHQSLDTTTRSLRITRQHLATIRSPFDLLPCGDTPPPPPE